MPANTVSVARPTKYGNPHRIGLCPECGVTHTREEAVAEFEAMLREPTLRAQDALSTLRGKNLACWCKIYDEKGLRVPCHADVLLRLANADVSASGGNNQKP